MCTERGVFKPVEQCVARYDLLYLLLPLENYSPISSETFTLTYNNMAPTIQTTSEKERRSVLGQAEPEDAQFLVDRAEGTETVKKEVQAHLIPPQEEKVRLQEKGMDFWTFKLKVWKLISCHRISTNGQRCVSPDPISYNMQIDMLISVFFTLLVFDEVQSRTAQRLARTLDEPHDAARDKSILDAMRAGAAGVTGEDMGLEEIQASGESR